jgi:hypothetical protein
MNTMFTAFLLGGFGMYPILVTGLILIVASVRYAIDTEPIRLRFIMATAVAMLAIMLFWTVLDIILMLKAMYDPSEAAGKELRDAFAHGLSAVLNQWALGLLDMTVASIVVAIGVYRSGRRQLRALEP